MIVKIKSYYLKQDINPKELIKYGFVQFGNNYSKGLICSTFDIRYYDDTRRFVFIDYPWKDSRGRKVKDYINNLIKDGLVELKINYEWLAIIGSWQNYSQKKKRPHQSKIGQIKQRRTKMERLTKKYIGVIWLDGKKHYMMKKTSCYNSYRKDREDVIDKLGQLEDIEERLSKYKEIGIYGLIDLFKNLTDEDIEYIVQLSFKKRIIIYDIR